MKIRRLYRFSLGLGLACGPADTSVEGVDPSLPYVEGRVPLPDCPSFDYSRCDISEPGCVETLAGIAHCLRGERAPLVAPLVTHQSEAEVFDRFSADALEMPRPEPDHFEIALSKFGLTEPRALEPEVVLERYSREIAAFYDEATKGIVIVDHPPDPERDEDLLGIQRPLILLHELVHALQDQAHDLGAFGDKYRGGSDQNLRAASVIEGEARLHERRYFAALAGLDITELDLEQSFDNLALSSERSLFDQADLYGRSPLAVPYGSGSRFVYEVWSDGGQGAVRALFERPPHSMQEVLAVAWGRESDSFEPIEVSAADMPFATSRAWTTLGAWGAYLLLEPLLRDRERSRGLALAWRGDRFEAFEADGGETLARWEIVLEDAAAAERFAEALREHALVDVSRGERSVILTPKP